MHECYLDRCNFYPAISAALKLVDAWTTSCIDLKIEHSMGQGWSKYAEDTQKIEVHAFLQHQKPQDQNEVLLYTNGGFPSCFVD